MERYEKILENNLSVYGIGYLGVDFHIKTKKYRASINRSGNQKHLKLCNTPEEAFQVYKTAKEQYIKEVADKWKGLISDKVYEAMYNYQVEITD